MDEKPQPKNVAERIQVVANICVIAAAVLLIISIGWMVVRHSSLSHVSHSSIQSGTKLTLQDLNWSQSRQTLLLVLSTGCKYCTASAPFYRHLISQTSLTNNTRLIAVFPQPINESEEYFGKLDIKINTLRQAMPASLGAKGTPTLILVDSDGTVIRSWEGMVSPAVENEILAAVK
jgi:thioredoxin-related protein